MPSLFAPIETPTPTPAPAPEEQPSVLSYIVNGLRQGSNAALSMPLTLAAPDPKLPGVAGYIPFTGNVEAIAGTVGSLGNKAVQLANAGLSAPSMPWSQWGLHVPELPQILTDAGQHFEENRQDIQRGIEKYSGGVLPRPDLSTTAGTIADVLGSSVGAGVGFAPGGIVNALPRGLKTVGSVLFPSIEHAATTVPITTALGTAQGAIDYAASPSPDAAPTTDATTQPPSLFATQATPAPVADTGATSLFAAPPPAPTFTQQGSTETPLWAAAASLGVGLLGLHIAGRFTHTVGEDVSTAARDTRFNDPAYAAQVQDYQNDVISRGPNSGTLLPPNGTPTAAPLPQGGLFNRVVTWIADKTVNNSAKVQNVLNLSASDPSMVERLSAMAGNMQDQRLQQDRTTNFLETGYDPRTGITVPSMTRLLDERANLSPDEVKTLAEGLKSLDEMNSRDRNERVWRNEHPGEDPSLEDIAHNMMGHGRDELQGFADAMMANPKLADMAQRYKAITDGTIDIGVHPNYGFFEPSEAMRLKTERSNYVPEKDVNGRSMHPFGERNTGAFTGQAQIMTDPIRDLADHLEQIYPQFEHNLFKRMVGDHLQDVQRVPGAPQFFTDVQSPTGAHASYFPQGGLKDVGGQARDPIVSYRTGTGVKYFRNDDPITRGLMTNQSLGAAHTQLGAANTARRIFQQFTTGIGSTLTGRSVPARTAVAVSAIAPLNAARNIRAGMLDYALQRASPGGRANPVLQSLVRGVDMPLNLLGMPVSYARGILDRRIKNFADVFHPEATNSANQWMRALAGDPVVDSIQQAAHNWWQESATNWIKRDVNVSGAGSAIRLDPLGVAPGSSALAGNEGVQRIRSLSAGLVPKAYFDGAWMGAKPFMISVRNVVAEALNNISDAGLDYVARLNRDNRNISPEALTYNLRGLYGNPARTGSSTAMRNVSGMVPWANIAMQELSSTGGAIAARPWGSAVTMATGVGTLALLELLTHMRSQEHMDFLQNRLSLQQREANVNLALNDDPNKPTMIPLPRSLRVAHAFMLDILSKALNMPAVSQDPDVFHGVWEGLKNFFSGHITTSDAMAMRHAGVDMFDFANLPPYAGHLDYNQAIQNGIANLPSAFHGAWSTPSSRELPGQATAPMDSTTGHVIRNVLENTIGAAAGTVFDTGANLSRYQKQGHPFLDSVGMVMHDWLQTGRESNMMGNNLLFETPIRLSKQSPIVETLEPTMLAIKSLPPIPNPSQTGFTQRGRGQLPVPVADEAPVSNDLLMRQMLLVAHGYKSKVDAAMAPINAIKQQMGAVEKLGMNPVERREWLNLQTRNIADRSKLIVGMTSDMNWALSRLAGKGIRLQDIHWNQDRSQFQ